MRTGEKNLIIRWLTCLLLIIIAAPLPAAYACTAVYVGSQASDDGTMKCSPKRGQIISYTIHLPAYVL